MKVFMRRLSKAFLGFLVLIYVLKTFVYLEKHGESLIQFYILAPDIYFIECLFAMLILIMYFLFDDKW